MRLAVITKNIAVLAGINGHKSVSALARHVGRHRFTVYRALRQPNTYRPTYNAICAALPIRSLPR